MRNLILFLLFASVVQACTKSGNDTQTDPAGTNPPSGFTLEYMEVEENLFGGYLYLYGSFGDSTAACRVRIGNNIVSGIPSANGTILKWTPGYIKVSIPDPNDDTGAGYVSVIKANQETNKRMLNVWEISLHYKQPDVGTILKEVHFEAYLRADAHPHRPVTTLNMPSSFAAPSLAHWEIGGLGQANYTGGGMTISLENRGGTVIWSKPYLDNTAADNNFQSEVKFRNGAFEISGLRMHKKNATKHSFQAHGSPSPFVTNYNFDVEVLPMNYTLKLELDNTRAIKAGKYVTGPHGTQYDFTWDASEAAAHMFYYTLEWEKVEPRFKM